MVLGEVYKFGVYIVFLLVLIIYVLFVSGGVLEIGFFWNI